VPPPPTTTSLIRNALRAVAFQVSRGDSKRSALAAWSPGRHRFVLALGHKLCAVVMRFVQIANKLQDASERRTEKKT